jgi:hypothetical protein
MFNIFNSQAGQDKFIINILKGKKNGYFLEIGSNEPIHINNTISLEKIFCWKGIMIEYSDEWLQDYKKIRENSIHIIKDATLIDYKELLKNSPKNIDYLQIDIEASNGSTIKTLEKLDNDIMDLYKFAVITFEHDHYCTAHGEYKYTRDRSRTIFKKHGYYNVFEDINDDNPNLVFEDWWVHPDLVDMEYVKNLKDINKNNYKENNLTNISINWKDINYFNRFVVNEIHIGNSKTNMKIIKLDKIYPSNTNLSIIGDDLRFYNKNSYYKDVFSYKFNNTELSITRTDENLGWGQDLVAYIYV